MHRTVSFVFGIIFTIVLTLILWTAFLNLQPNMFNGFETALSEEWNRDTGDNGQVVNDIKTNIWFSNSNSETVYSAYNHS